MQTSQINLCMCEKFRYRNVFLDPFCLFITTESVMLVFCSGNETVFGLLLEQEKYCHWFNQGSGTAQSNCTSIFN